MSSVQITAYVWHETSLAGNELLVALALADHVGNERGLAWPSVGRLCEMTRLSERTVQRMLKALVAGGELDVERDGGGRKPTLYRFTMQGRQIVAPVTAGTSGVSQVTPELEGNCKSSPSKAPSPEPVGFGGWLGRHCELAGRSVPRAGTSARAKLAGTFGALVAEGYSIEDLELASDGVLADPFMVENGHTAAENVLRKTKLAKRVDDGRRARAAAAARPDRTDYGGELERLNAEAMARAEAARGGER